MKRLGAILAGGKATRFGSDKAAALLDSRPLIEHVADGLRNQVDYVVICGRKWPEMDSIEDRPDKNHGPLGGLNAALHYAKSNGFDLVISAGCDVIPVAKFPTPPINDIALFIEGHFLFGIWPAELADRLDEYLDKQTDLSMRSWIADIGAKGVRSNMVHHNLNTSSDLDRYNAAQLLAI